MIGNLNNERLAFRDAMKAQLSANHSAMVQPSADEINRSFKGMLGAFQS